MHLARWQLETSKTQKLENSSFQVFRLGAQIAEIRHRAFETFKNSKILKFEHSKIRKFKNSNVRKFKNSKVQKIENSKSRKFKNSKNLQLRKFENFENSKIQHFENSKNSKIQNFKFSSVRAGRVQTEEGHEGKERRCLQLHFTQNGEIYRVHA